MIEHLFDEALLVALREGRRQMNFDDVMEAKLTEEIGLKQPVVYTEQDREAVATHEAGHATVAYFLGQNRRLEVLSIIKRRGSLGLLAHGDDEERFTRTRTEIEAGIAIALGGLVAEELCFGEAGTGPAADLAHATSLAAQMVGSFGMAGSLISYDAIAEGPIGGANLVGKVLADSEGRQRVEDILEAQRERVVAVLEDEPRRARRAARRADRPRRAGPRRDPRGHRAGPVRPRLSVDSRLFAGRLVDSSAWLSESVIVAGARTPIGKFRGSLAGFKAVELGAVAIRGALERAGVAPEQVEYSIMGHVLQAGQGQITARQAAIAAGIPKEVPAITVNKVCLSGTSAIAIADQMIRAGELEIAVAGGMESMTNAPFVLPKAREGSRLGDTEMLDSMIHDGLWCAFDDRHMGEGTDAISAELGITREDQDAWAARSHAARARCLGCGPPRRRGRARRGPAAEGRSGDLRARRGDPAETTVEALAELRPAFTPDGTVTAGNASQISDGAAAVVVTSADVAERMGLEPIAEIVAYGMSADRYRLAAHGAGARDGEGAEEGRARGRRPRPARDQRGVRGGRRCTPPGCSDIDEELVNVNGGAVALGHPIGASGARIVLTLALEMQRRGVDLGAAAICGGGGQGDALILRRL